MVGTFQALGVVLLAIVPGAALTFSYENHAGTLPGDTNDRLLRFLIGTALVFPFTAILGAWAYARVLHVPVPDSPGDFHNRLSHPTDLSPLWTLVPLLYIVVPWGAGVLAGKGWLWLSRKGATTHRAAMIPSRLAAFHVEFLRQQPGAKHVTMKLRSGEWVAGIFGDESFASPPAAREKELLLESRLAANAAGMIQRDEDNNPIQLGGAVVVKYADVELMFIEQV